MSIHLLGRMTLNISFVVYIIHYLPQLYRNSFAGKISGLSVNFHYLLLGSFLFDLIYGFGMGMPWQYRAVTLFGIGCIFIQHWQLMKFYKSDKFYKATILGVIFLLVLGVFLKIYSVPKSIFDVAGYFSQFCGLAYMVPQIFKNIRSNTARSISLQFLGLNLFCNVCDIGSAWALHWPMPSRIGAIVKFAMIVALMYQCLRQSANSEFGVLNRQMSIYNSK